VLSFEICRKCVVERTYEIGRGHGNGSIALERDLHVQVLEQLDESWCDQETCPLDAINGPPFETKPPKWCKYALEQLMYADESA
jgi:hypothetical protein